MKVLMVCLGNICRSPTAEAVMRARAAQQGVDLTVDSAGTAAWHTGNPPDPRSQQAGLESGYDLSPLRARQVQVQDFYDFDYVLAMDESNYGDLAAIRPDDATAKLRMFDDRPVPDPYYGGDEGFQVVIEQCEQACDEWLAQWAGE